MAVAKTKEEPLSPTMEETVGAATKAVTLAPLATPVPVTGMPTKNPVVADAKTKLEPLSPPRAARLGVELTIEAMRVPAKMPVPLIGWPTAAAPSEEAKTRLVPLKPPVAVSDATVELLANVAPVTPARPPKLNVARFAPTVPVAPVTLRLSVPEPAALALPKEVVPAPEIVRPPVKVLLPDRVTVFAAVPWRVSVKLPTIGPVKALAEPPA